MKFKCCGKVRDVVATDKTKPNGNGAPQAVPAASTPQPAVMNVTVNVSGAPESEEMIR